MKKTPKSLRLQLGLFGRTNVGKSSFLNMVSGQDVAITSPVPGTTTDVVEKTMEFLPLGPVVFLDTGGLDDISVLSGERIKRTKKIFDRADIVILVIEPGYWGEFEQAICAEAGKRNTPLIIIVNKIDITQPSESFIEAISKQTPRFVLCCSVNKQRRDEYVNNLKRHLLAVCPDDFMKPPLLIADLLPPGGLAVLIVPIDMEAPKGRIILPQVQTIRDILDNDAAALIVKEGQYRQVLETLKRPPDIVVCDSQVVLKMTADTPADVKCTTFSILFARYKGDLIEMAKGAAAIERLSPKDKVLIAEACSHHPIEDDIGRVKIPRWLKQYTGADLDIDICSGRDYPENLTGYKLIIHCGSCMLTRRETFFRIQQARQAAVPITNYGVCVSLLHGVIKRVLAPFPAALDAFNHKQHKRN